MSRWKRSFGDFKAAGLGSIPGGGGEILVDRVRQRISPLKAMSDDWLEVMDVAHRLGLNSSATMMFGHVETIEDRIEHLERLRTQQDKSKGFTAFICWTFQAEHTKLQSANGRRARISAHAGAGPDLPRQFHERPKFMGHARPGNRPGRAEVWRERSRQHHD